MKLSNVRFKHSIFAKVRGWATFCILVLLIAGLLPLPVQAQTPEEEIPVAETTVVEQYAAPDGIHTVIRIGVQKDAFISSSQPDRNFGGDPLLRLGWSRDLYNAMRILIQFDISGIPTHSSVNSATLYIYQAVVIPSGENTNMGYRSQFMGQPWDEFGVTWNNANYLGGDVLSQRDVDSNIGWKSVDVTNVVKTWQSGARPNYGLIVTGDETSLAARERYFYSHERSDGPYIEVDYSSQSTCDTIAPVASIVPLPTFSPGEFPVTWSATDSAPSNCNPSGVASYDVEYRINGSDWHSWKNQTQATTNHFKNWAANNDFVEFRARATDNAGNVQPYGNPQTSTRIDTVPPQTNVNPLPAVTTSSTFILSWNGSDNLSGVANYDVQWRENSGDWQTLLEESTQTSYQVTGAQSGVTYDFRVRATDNVGNSAEWTDQPQASTQIAATAVATVSPFVPSILKPTAPVTNTFPVRWTLSAGGVASAVQIYFQYGNSPWILWQSFPSSQTSALFPFQGLGLGDGVYGFEAVAIGVNGEREPQNSLAEATMLVDLANAVHPTAFVPVVTNEFNAVSTAENHE